MKSKINCNEKKNRNIWACKIKKICDRKENDFISAGKGVLSIAFPASGIAITATNAIKSLGCGINRRLVK